VRRVKDPPIEQLGPLREDDRLDDFSFDGLEADRPSVLLVGRLVDVHSSPVVGRSGVGAREGQEVADEGSASAKARNQRTPKREVEKTTKLTWS